MRRLVAVGVCGVLLLAASPAHADERRVPDRADPGLRPAEDIVKVRLVNGPQQLRAVVRLRGLRAKAHATVVVAFKDGRGAPHEVTVTGPANPSQVVRFEPNLGDGLNPIRCRGLRVRWHPGTPARVVVNVPFRCGGAAYDRFVISTPGDSLESPATLSPDLS